MRQADRREGDQRKRRESWVNQTGKSKESMASATLRRIPVNFVVLSEDVRVKGLVYEVSKFSSSSENGQTRTTYLLRKKKNPQRWPKVGKTILLMAFRLHRSSNAMIPHI